MIDVWLKRVFEILGPQNIYRVFLLIRLFYLAIDWILSLFIGYSLQHGFNRNKKRSEITYDYSAHFMTVLMRCNVAPTTISFLHNYIMIHDRYAHPKEILENDKLTLQGVTNTHVWFCVSDINVYDTSVIPFAFLAQYLTAKQVVVMTHEHFNALAEKIDAKTLVDLTLIHNTARCGSTLLCQMFNQLPETRVMSEPWSFMHAHRIYNLNQISKLDYHKLMRSMVKITCKPTAGIHSIIIKVSILCSPQIPMIKAIFPHTKLIFNTRHIEPSQESFCRVFSQIPDALPSEKGDFWFFYLPFSYGNEEYKRIREKYSLLRRELPFLYQLIFSYGGSLMVYLENKHKYESAILYEDLIENPIKECEILFAKLGIPESHAEAALKGMKEDSQKNMFPKVQTTKYLKNRDWDIADRLLKVLNSPVRKNMSVDELRNLVK